MKNNLYLFVLFVILISSNAFSQTYIPPSDVYGNWTLNNSPYYIQGDITIPNDSVLLIEPGVSIIFQDHYGFFVQGRLLAIGTEENNITITVNDTTGFYDPDATLGGWYGIRFLGTASENDTSKIIFCNLQYGKAVGTQKFGNSGGAICILNFDKVIISNCFIANCSAGGSGYSYGGAIAVGHSDIQLSDNIISNCKADAGGAVHFYDSDPLIINNTFQNNFATDGGGAVDIQALSHPIFINNQIMNNHSSGAGGAINIAGDSTSVTINGSIISGNISNFGGAINAWNCELQLNDCNFADNSSRWLGGSIRAGFSKIEIDSTNFERDTTGSSGGGVYVIHCDLSIDNSEFNSNSATNYGGALRSDSSSIMINNSKFEKNLALWGGGIYNLGSQFYLHNCEFTENTSTHGGAVYTGYGSLEFSNVSFSQNSSGWGGGIGTVNSTMKLDSCLFTQNHAVTNSGAIDYDIDTLSVSPPYQFKAINSKFVENSAVQFYGAIKILQPAFGVSLVNVLIDKCEFEKNSSTRSGAIRLDGNMKDFVISNSLFSKNLAGTQSACAFWRGASGKIYNCLFNSNISQTGLGSLLLSDNSKVDFINCAIVNNIGVTSGGLKIQNKSDSKVINSIFWGNYPDQISLQSPNDTSASSIYLNYNDIQYGIDSIKLYDTISLLNWGVGNIDFYPLFEDTLNSDYHLQSLSPCIATGIDSIEIAGFWYHCPSIDIEGNPRPFPIGTMPDIGAYESQSPLDVKDENKNIPFEYTLFQNYPNPFNPITTIGFGIPEKTNVRLSVLNILGKEIKILLNEETDTGHHSVDFNGSDLPSTVYFYRIQSGNFVETKKMLLLK